MASFSTESLISLLSSLFFIVIAEDSTCEWRFDSCKNNGKVWRMECEVDLIRTDKNGRPCGYPFRRKTHVSWKTNYQEFCTIVPKCAIASVWCSWGPWESTYSDCELERTRRKCCHPTTLRRDRRISCSSYQDTERKESPKGCTEKKDEEMDQQQFKIFIRDCILITISVIFVLVTCTVSCRLYCRYRSERAQSSASERRSRTQDQPPPYPHLQMQRPLVPAATYHHGDVSRVVISAPMLDPYCSREPPSYEEAIKAAI